MDLKGLQFQVLVVVFFCVKIRFVHILLKSCIVITI